MVLDTHFATTALMTVIGLMAVCGTIGTIGAFWSLGRQNERKD